MIAAGAAPKAIQKMLGHRSVAFTLTVYGHMFDEIWTSSPLASTCPPAFNASAKSISAAERKPNSF
jgi:hypothetical protein